MTSFSIKMYLDCSLILWSSFAILEIQRRLEASSLRELLFEKGICGSNVDVLEALPSLTARRSAAVSCTLVLLSLLTSPQAF